ncbi:MAG TPA: Gfo/Idh/MocA family oxidoreductase [Trebonia sp.]|jgi:1,5-anhydro-D-fructose reductase (1,5-anhydro-D-mannitol-forming)|nr:Gfo/Idh/MocA family oxidoreductase [Trebonia sp.]
MSISWGIIGAGKLADLWIAPAITRDEGSTLAAVCGRDAGRAQAFARRHGVPGAYDDYEAFLADESIDVVYIATPNGRHKDEAIAALNAGKHVLVEKPMALSLDDGRRMRDAAAGAGRQLGVGFHLRHKHINREARRLVSDGQLGRTFFLEASVGAGKGLYPYDTWRSDPALAGGGTVLNQGTHTIDLVEFLTGQKVVEVAAIADHESEDVFVGSCVLDGGLLASLSSHQLHAGTRPDWVLFGEAAWLRARGGTSPVPGDELLLAEGGSAKTIATSGELSAYDDEVRAFAAAVALDQPFDADGNDGLRAIAVAEAVYRSVREGRRVPVPEIR